MTRLGGGLLGRAISGSTAVAATPGIVIVDHRATTRTTAHELFHLIQLAIFRRATLDILLGEALANWGAYRFVGQGSAPAPQPSGQVGPDALAMPWASLDCRSNCGRAGRRGGYDQWPFFMYLSEHFGDGVIEEILEQVRCARSHRSQAARLRGDQRGAGRTRQRPDAGVRGLHGRAPRRKLQAPAAGRQDNDGQHQADRDPPQAAQRRAGRRPPGGARDHPAGARRHRNCASRRVKLSVAGPRQQCPLVRRPARHAAPWS